MKILHIIDHFVPQMGYQETHLARVQSNKGHEVRVLTSQYTNRCYKHVFC